MKTEELRKIIDSALLTSGIDSAVKDQISKALSFEINSKTSVEFLKERLAVRFEYEKHYLELIKTFKEEIKFAASIQEDLRKERSKFFSETLREVSNALKDSQVDGDVASIWLKELVDSYTKSLDLSGGLVEEHSLDTIGKIRSGSKNDMLESGDKE